MGEVSSQSTWKSPRSGTPKYIMSSAWPGSCVNWPSRWLQPGIGSPVPRVRARRGSRPPSVRRRDRPRTHRPPSRDRSASAPSPASSIRAPRASRTPALAFRHRPRQGRPGRWIGGGSRLLLRLPGHRLQQGERLRPQLGTPQGPGGRDQLGPSGPPGRSSGTFSRRGWSRVRSVPALASSPRAICDQGPEGELAAPVDVVPRLGALDEGGQLVELAERPGRCRPARGPANGARRRRRCGWARPGPPWFRRASLRGDGVGRREFALEAEGRMVRTRQDPVREQCVPLLGRRVAGTAEDLFRLEVDGRLADQEVAGAAIGLGALRRSRQDRQVGGRLAGERLGPLPTEHDVADSRRRLRPCRGRGRTGGRWSARSCAGRRPGRSIRA